MKRRAKAGTRIPVLFVFGLSAVTVSSVSAFAEGGVNGGGARAVVCRSSSGRIRSAELLDLWEARVLNGIELRKPRTNFELDWKFTLSKAFIHFFGFLMEDSGSPIPSEDLADMDQYIRSSLKFLPDSVRLTEVNDSFEPAAPAGCKIEQLANFYDDRKVLVQKEIYSALDPLHRSAFLVHEFFYLFRRQQRGDADSRYTRRWIGTFFSKKGLSPIGNSDRGEAVECYSSAPDTHEPFSYGTKFKLRASPDGKSTLVEIAWYDHSWVDVKTWTVFPANIIPLWHGLPINSEYRAGREYSSFGELIDELNDPQESNHPLPHFGFSAKLQEDGSVHSKITVKRGTSVLTFPAVCKLETGR